MLEKTILKLIHAIDNLTAALNGNPPSPPANPNILSVDQNDEDITATSDTTHQINKGEWL